MPKFSVIIPTYNRCEFVKNAIQSVLDQTYKDYEIIVIDDGSTDSTKDSLSSIIEQITYIYQDNRGVSSARNTGIKKSIGSYIAFLDSDDLWEPKKLELQYQFILANPDIKIHQTEDIWIR